jgi:hypothetical protein
MENDDEKPENPSAFPCAKSDINYNNQSGEPFQSGMTLRDYFAAHAMSGFLSSREIILAADPGSCRNLAGSAYEYADEMLKEREVKNDKG